MSPWNKLSDDTADNIFSRLLIHDVGRLRCTCKRFKAVTSSDQFLRLYSQNHCTRPCLLLLVPFGSLGSERAYDPALDAWKKWPLDFLRLCLQEWSYPVASDGGLLCFGSGRDFVVCNPTTKSWKKLPKVPCNVPLESGNCTELSFEEDFEQALGLAFDRTTGVYELLMINTSSASETIQTISYNSSTGLWKGQPEPAKSASRRLFSSKIVACNHSFYSLWKHRTSFVVYCFAQSVWNVIKCPTFPLPFPSCHLIHRYGCLHIMGVVRGPWNGSDIWQRATDVRIWKLDQESKEWEGVARVPRPILDECNERVDFDQLRCFGKDDIIYMRSPASDILMHDFRTEKWQWLGKQRDLDLEIGAVLMEPSLSAVA